MGLLVSRLFKLFWKKEEIKLVLVGLDNAGKTTVLYKILLNEVVSTTPTIGSNVEEVVYRNIHFLMWDIGGQESLRSSWSTYYVNTKAVIMVIDSTDRDRLHISNTELHSMMENENLKHSILLILANKQDIKGFMTAAQISEALKLTTLKDRQWHIQVFGLTEQMLEEYHVFPPDRNGEHFVVQASGHQELRRVLFEWRNLPKPLLSRYPPTGSDAITVLAKPTNLKEVQFYHDVCTCLPQLSAHIPPFYGYSASSSSVMSSQCAVLYLGDLTKSMKSPCVMDIKLGTRHHDSEATPAKVEKMQRAVAATTSLEFGLRICGALVSNLNGVETAWQFSKEQGKKLADKLDLAQVLKTFSSFADGSKHIETIRDQITAMLAVLVESQRCVRMYSVSLLICYDRRNSENVACKLIDFAHSHISSEATSDDRDGCVMGLTNVLSILEDLRIQPR